jgi:predicted CxxxxCH...CXXCH cytochrome family protein
MAGNCAACHSGGGSGTSSHGTSLKVAFASGFNATAGATAFTGTVCTNISCHGGATTPVWGGTLDVATSCMVCHQSGTQTYIGYNSGRHSLHLGIGVICTDCHDMANDAAHFGNVTSKIFETAPATTLRSFLRYAQASGSCMVITPTPPGVQFTGCHGGTEVWR